MLRLKPFSTPLKVANAVPTIGILAIENVHEDYAIHIVSKRTRTSAGLSYATAASLLIRSGEVSPVLGESMVWRSMQIPATAKVLEYYVGQKAGRQHYMRDCYCSYEAYGCTIE